MIYDLINMDCVGLRGLNNRGDSRPANQQGRSRRSRNNRNGQNSTPSTKKSKPVDPKDVFDEDTIELLKKHGYSDAQIKIMAQPDYYEGKELKGQSDPNIDGDDNGENPNRRNHEFQGIVDPSKVTYEFDHATMISQIQNNGLPNLNTLKSIQEWYQNNLGINLTADPIDTDTIDKTIQEEFLEEDRLDRQRFKPPGAGTLEEEYSYNGLQDPINFTDPHVVIDPSPELLQEIKATVPNQQDINGQNPQDRNDHNAAANITEVANFLKLDAVAYPLIVIDGVVIAPAHIIYFCLDYTEFIPSITLVVDLYNNQSLIGKIGFTSRIAVIMTGSAQMNSPYRKISVNFSKLECILDAERNSKINAVSHKTIYRITGEYFIPHINDVKNAAIVYDDIPTVMHQNRLINQAFDEDKNAQVTIYIDAFHKLKNDGYWFWYDTGKVVDKYEYPYLVAGQTYIHKGEIVHVRETQNKVKYEAYFDDVEKKAYEIWKKKRGNFETKTKTITTGTGRHKKTKTKTETIYKPIEEFRKSADYEKLVQQELQKYEKAERQKTINAARRLKQEIPKETPVVAHPESEAARARHNTPYVPPQNNQ